MTSLLRQQREGRSGAPPGGFALDKQIAALDEHAIVSVADLAGDITYVNALFCQVSGYSREELLGRNHRLLKSGRHPDAFYGVMWQQLRAGQAWHGTVCNRRKDGSYYWVQSTILPVCDATGAVAEYVSVRTDITPIKEAEERLRLYERAFTASTSGIVTIDACAADYPAIDVSPSFLALTGYRADEVLGHNLRYMMGTDVPTDVLERLHAAMAAGRPAGALLRNYRKDGGRYYAALRLSPAHDDAGVLTHYLAIVDDVTELRHAQTRLLDAGERMRLSQRFANIATWDWHTTGGRIVGSERLGPLLGLPVQEDFSTAAVAETLVPQERPRVRDILMASLARAEPFEFECRCRWPDGSEHWLLTRGESMPGTGRTPDRMVGVVQDVTRRKTAEIALARSQARLMEAQQLARLGHWELAPDTGRMYWCERIFELLDLDPAATPTDIGTLREVVHPGDAPAFDAWLAQAPQHDHSELTHRCVLPGGGVRYLQQRARLDDAGRLIGTMQDVTDRMIQEEQLRSAKEAAEQASAAKSSFLSSMSHELRTPLNAILGFAQLLELDDRLDATAIDQVGEILTAGRHLLSLIDEVLDLARVESGHVHVDLQTVSVMELVRECAGWAASLDEARDIVFRTAVPAGLVAWADRRRLRQVLVNLLTNAVKYNRRPGWVAIEAAERDAGRVRLTVRDGGLGMTPQQLAQLFQPFTRLHARHAEGTGIGLTLSKRLIELMDGTIGVASESGVGTEFWIELPRHGIRPSDPGPRGSAGGPAGRDAWGAAARPGDEPPRHRPRVLYIEDHPGNRVFMQEVFALRPALALTTAVDGEAGLGAAAAEPPDLILLDIHLPGLDGYGVLQALRADARLRAIPVVALSAVAMQRDIERGLAAGFDDYLVKPVQVAALLDRLDTWLAPAASADAHPFPAP